MSGAPLAEAERLHRRAVHQFNIGEPAKALAALRRAWRVLEPVAESSRGATALAARIWISTALDTAEVHGIDAGMDALAHAERWVKAADDPSIDVLMHSQRAFVEIRRRQLPRALDELCAAVDLLDAAEPRDQCVILLNRGTVYLYLGDVERARTDLEAAADRAAAIGDLVQEFKARHNLGYLEFIRGNAPRSLLLMADALALEAPVSKGIAFLDRARVLAESGLAQEATRSLLLAAETFRAERRGQDLGEAYVELARCALVAGDFASVRRYAADARARFRRRGNDRWRRSAELVMLQGDLAAGRPGSRLVRPALQLQSDFESEGAVLAARSAALIAAEAWLSAGDAAAARRVLDGISRPDRLDPVTGRLHHAYVSALFHAAKGDGRGASRLVRSGLAELTSHQSKFGSIDLQTASAVHGRRIADLGIQLALDTGRPDAVLGAAERARAVSSRLSPVRPPDDAVSAELLAELRQTVESLHSTTHDRDAASSLHAKRRELERQITARRWTLAGTGDVRPSAKLAELRAALCGEDATMVVYVEAGGRLHAVCLAAGRLRLHTLGDAPPVIEHVRRARADLDVLAQPRLPGGLRAAVRGSLRRSLAVLEDSAISPLGVGDRRLVIVSTGVLGQLPWGALPSLRGVPVVVAPSATAWLNASSTDARDGMPEVLAIAGPDLERAEDEVAGIRAAWPNAQALVGSAADRLGVARAVGKGVAVAHVAAHGVHQTENPLFSSLRLADGPMFAHELDQTARTPEHVILSACELGLATVRPGDEALGLTSVLLHLGTRSVVAGVARVGDDVAAETMIAYHRSLAAGRDSAAALAEALAGLDSEQPAPFVCFGSSWGI